MEAEMTMLNKLQQNDDETRSASWPTDDGHHGNRMSLETATLLAACLSGFLFQVDLTAFAGAYEGPRRARAFGLWGTIVGASMVAGPPLGSFLAGTIGWRWIFWINLPLCAVLIFLALCRIGSGLDQQRSSAKVDWLGAGLLAITSAALAFMLLEAPALGGIASTTILTGLAASGIALLLFVWVEHRHPNPAFDLKLFGSRQFIAMCLVP